jgi:glycosyltransferase involved in cell wall biosynthesis
MMLGAPSDVFSVPTRAARDEEPIRLLHLTTSPLSLRFLSGQAHHMCERGIEVHVLSSPGAELDSFAAREGVHAHAVQMERRISPLRDLVALFRIFRVLRSIRPRIVHAHTPKAGLLGIVAAWFARVPVRIYHVHGLRFATCRGLRRSLLRSTERISCLLAHRVLCVSRSLCDVAVAQALCSADKIRVLLGGSVNGIDVERFRPANALTRASARTALGISSDAFVIGLVARVVREKGIVELASAWRTLREMFADLRLLVVGPVEPEDPVPAEVLDLLRSDPRVTLRGLDWETPPLYAAMDLFVLPTYREGLPSSTLEAAAMGLPVVATRIPGCIDTVQDGVTGTLVPPRDIPALVEAIARYRLDPLLRREHGQRGWARVSKEFRQEAIWNATRAEYFALLAERGLRGSGVREQSVEWRPTASPKSHRGEP